MAVAVVHGGKTVYAKGFGVREVGKDDKVDADTVFQLASLSKSVAASVVAHQVGTGSVTWDTPIVSKRPGFALKDPYVTQNVTIGDMFAHRSGLVRGGGLRGGGASPLCRAAGTADDNRRRRPPAGATRTRLVVGSRSFPAIRDVALHAPQAVRPSLGR
jgi:CubicO group peptidase (beta-lactamase class C family)